MDFKIFRLAGLAMMALALTGCPPKKQIKEDEPVSEEAAKAQQEEPSLRGKDFQEVPELKSVFFDTDSSTLEAEARTTLQANVEVLKAKPDWEALIEGHCDERGTTEYNLGLGQRRAAAVRQYYMSLGLKGSRVATISYGKENPVCSEATEGCWAKNRRAVTKARVMVKK